MKDRVFFDPLEDEKQYNEDQTPYEYIRKLPRGAKYLYAKGHVAFLPKLPLIVGSCYDIEFRYFPEDRELPIGTQIEFSIPRTWTQPQSEDASRPGFVSAARSAHASCKVDVAHNENLQWWVTVEINDITEPGGGMGQLGLQECCCSAVPSRSL